MNYDRVCLEAIGYTLPQEVVTSAQLEHRLKPLYDRLRLPEGRLELMTGISERRLWPVGTLPSGPSIATAEAAILRSGVDRARIGALIHASVCRDHLEPATACKVHHALALRPDCQVYDVSNACLGLLTGALQVANMIELGQIEAGLVVGTEDSRPLLEHTVERLNSDQSITRSSVKHAVASLTIGSGSAALLLTHKDLSRAGNRLLAAQTLAASQHHELCTSGRDEPATSMRPWMTTDSEKLMQSGVAVARDAFGGFLDEAGWARTDVTKTICHQVGSAHRRKLFSSLGLDPALDFSTVEFLGNTGSVALPITAGMAYEQGRLEPFDRVAFLGIGSGINVVMLAVDWRQSADQSTRMALATMSRSK